MKKNKKLNLSEAAAQVMGVKGVLDATGKSDMDASGVGSMVPSPVNTTGASAVAASAAQPGVPAVLRTAAGVNATAAYQDSGEDNTEEDTANYTDAQEDEGEPVETNEELKAQFRDAIISLLGEDNVNKSSLEQLEAIFEAAVSDRVEAEVAKVLVELDENAKDYLSNVTNSLVEKVDDYLEYVVEEWMTENTVAVEQGIKTTIAENFISGLKNLFENHYIDVPNEKYNVLDELYEQNRKLQEALNESMKSSIDLKKEIALTECAGIFVAETKNLADTQVNKLQNLMENVNFNSPEEYRNKLVAIKENYLQGNRVSVPSRAVDEDMTFSKAVSTPVTLVENYANVLGRLNKKL